MNQQGQLFWLPNLSTILFEYENPQWQRPMSHRSKVPHFESQRLQQQLSFDNGLLLFAMTGQGVTSHQNINQTRWVYLNEKCVDHFCSTQLASSVSRFLASASKRRSCRALSWLLLQTTDLVRCLRLALAGQVWKTGILLMMLWLCMHCVLGVLR